MRRVLVPVIATVVLIVLGAVVTLGIAYRVMSNRFVAGDTHALDGIVRVPVRCLWASGRSTGLARRSSQV